MSRTFPTILAIPAILLMLTPGYARSQKSQEPVPVATPQPAPEVAVEEDPTKPVVFSIRNEYRNLKNNAWANTLIFRFDKATFRFLRNKGGAKGLLLRFDIPFNTVHAAAETKVGLGDLYAQALYIPYVRQRFALAVGTGIVLPTATNDLLGRGKLIFSPTVVPVWYLKPRKRIFLVRFQNYVSVAGKSSRPDVNYLLAAPMLINRLNRKWWVLVDTEFKWDWESKLGSGISGIQLGRMFRRKYGFWLKPEIPWGPGRQGDFTLKFTVFRVR
jgi:hypothetical protein